MNRFYRVASVETSVNELGFPVVTTKAERIRKPPIREIEGRRLVAEMTNTFFDERYFEKDDYKPIQYKNVF